MELLYELLFHPFFSLTQMFVIAMWEIDDPKLIRMRNVCLVFYGCGFSTLLVAVLSVWLGGLQLSGFILLFFCAFGILLIAGHLADRVEKLVLKQNTPGQQTEGEE